MRRILALCCALALAAAVLPAMAASGTPSLKSYKKALQYVKENRPEELDLGDVRLKPRELLAILREMPEGAALHFVTSWAGTRFSDTSTEVNLNKSSQAISAEDMEALLILAPGLRLIRSEKLRGVSNEKVIPLIEKYPEVEFVWMIRLGKNHYLPSNATAFSTYNRPDGGYRLKSDEMEPIRYCAGLKALDLGHSELTDLSFLRYFPDLELLILAQNEITDITPIGELKHLQYLEIFGNRISDISPLANCTELLDLNISNNPLSDISPLEGLAKLERLWAHILPNVPAERMEQFKADHPDVLVRYQGIHATPSPWRQHERFKHYQWCFKNKTWVPFDEPLPTRKN